jgi:hypothetical protein
MSSLFTYLSESHVVLAMLYCVFDHLFIVFYIIYELKGQVRCIVIRIGRDNSSASLTCLDISLAIPVPQLIVTPSSSLTWRELGAEKRIV